MKTHLTGILLALAVAAPASADKPEWAGKGKPTAEQKDAHRSAMRAKGDLDKDIDDSGGNPKKEKIRKGKKEKSSRGDSGDSDGMKKDKGARGDSEDSGDSDGMGKEKSARGDDDDTDDSDGPGRQKDRKTEEYREDRGELKGLKKQREMKPEQVQKELGQGSQTGQDARQDRKKWWRFWGE